MELMKELTDDEVYCLNPYYNGRYSWSKRAIIHGGYGIVLILIIMEDTHGVKFS